MEPGGEVVMVETNGVELLKAGFQLSERGVAQSGAGSQETSFTQRRRIPKLPPIAGLLAAALLVSLYIAIVSVAQGFDHALELVLGEWYFTFPIAAGFGLQVGLFVYVRTHLNRRGGMGSTTAMTGAGTGTSTVSMVACCAHHLTDVLPIVGISGAALFLSDYRGPMMILGIATNAVGIALMLRIIKRNS